MIVKNSNHAIWATINQHKLKQQWHNLLKKLIFGRYLSSQKLTILEYEWNKNISHYGFLKRLTSNAIFILLTESMVFNNILLYLF